MTATRVRKWLRIIPGGVGLAIVVAGVLSCVVGGDIGVGIASGSVFDGFCQGTVGREFLRPARELPKLHRLPDSGRLPFAQGDVAVSSTFPEGIVLRGAYFGLVLSAEKVDTVDWNIEGEVDRLSQKGRIRGRPSRHTWSIKTIGADSGERRIGFSQNTKFGLYKAEFTFRSSADQLLGSYAEYFRVVPRQVAARIDLRSDQLTPDSRLYLRLENRGTVPLLYGYDLRIERWSGNAWEMDPATPDSWTLEGVGLGPGAIGSCESVSLGSPLLGSYRASKEVGTLSNSRRVWSVRAYFQIVE